MGSGAHPAERSREETRLLAAAMVAAVGSLAGLVAAAPAVTSGERGAVIAVWSIFALVFPAAALPSLRSAIGARASVAVLLGALGAVPGLTLAAHVSLTRPVVIGDWECGTVIGLLGCPLIALAIGVGFATFLAARYVDPERASSRRGLRGAALLVASASLLLTAFGARRALVLPTPDAWAGTLPVTFRIDYFGWERSTHYLGGGVALERECDYDGACGVSIRRVPLRAAAGDDVTARTLPCDRDRRAGRTSPVPDAVCGHRTDVGTLGALGRTADVLRVEQIGAWIVRSDDSSIAFGADLERRAIIPRDVAGEVAVPWPLVLASIAGLLLSLLAFAQRARLGSLARRVARGRPCVVDAEGIAFDDGELPARGAIHGEAHHGVAVAIAELAPGSPGYRDDGTRSAWRVIAGTREQQLLVLRARITACDAFVLAATGLTSAPMLVALAMGLVV